MKLKVLMAVLVVSTVMTGCQKKEDEQGNQPTEVSSEPVVVDIDTPIDEPEAPVVEPTTEQQKIQFDIPDMPEPETVVEETETVLTMHINDIAITMPLTYEDLEAQGLSVDYTFPIKVSNGITRVFDMKEDDWISARDALSKEVVRVRDDRSVTNSKIITNTNKISAMCVADSFANVTYFDLVRGQSTYAQVDEVFGQLGFDSVKYINEGMDEYIVGNININGNKCQVWAAISIFEEAGVLKDIFFVNESICGSELAEGYSYRSNPYGTSGNGGLSSDITEIVTEDIMTFHYDGQEYSTSTTLKEFGERGWKVTAMDAPEDSGLVTLTMKKDNVTLLYSMSKLYVTSEGKKHVFAEDALASSLVFDESCLQKLDLYGLSGVVSESKIKDSGLGKYITDEGIDGITCVFDTYGNMLIGMSGGYMDSLQINYER